MELVGPWWKRCVTGLGFEVSKANARLSVCLPAACGSGCKSLSYCPSTMPSSCHDDNGLISEAASKAPI